MKRKDIYTLSILFVLTILTALFSITNSIRYTAFIIMALSGIKFILVAFQFMELKKAHSLWKGLLIGFLAVFVVAINIIIQ